MVKQIALLLKNNKRTLIFCLFSILLILPYLLNIVINSKYSYLPESSVLNMNLDKYFHDILSSGQNFVAGNRSQFLFNLLPFYSLLKVLGIFFNLYVSYFLIIMFFVLFSYRKFVSLLHLFLSKTQSDETRFLKQVCIMLLGFLFYSSLSNFMFISDNIAFYLPILILIIQIESVVGYLLGKNTLYLFFLISIFNSFNITSFVINTVIVNLIVLIYFIKKRKPVSDFLRKFIFINCHLLIPLILIVISFVIGAIFSTKSIDQYTSVIKEDFYSLNANLINTLTQTNFWSFGGTYNGVLYYSYSTFYLNPFVRILGLIPYYLIIMFAFLRKRISKVIPVLLSISILFVMQLMLGDNNPIFKYLYDNVYIFQMFRNIAKFAPILLLLVVSLIAIIVSSLKSKKTIYLILVLIALSCIYNLPYWTDSISFFSNRSVVSIPEYWISASSYLNSNLNSEDKILVMPAVYIGETYNWEGKRNSIQGYLFDAYLERNINSYRLSNSLVGSVAYQSDSSKLFIPSNRSIRGYDVNYIGLTDFVKKYGFDFIVLTKDLVSDFQNIEDVYKWLDQNKYQKIKSYGEVEIFFNSEVKKSFATINGMSERGLEYMDNAWWYELNLTNLTNSEFIDVEIDSNSSWKAYFVPDNINKTNFLWQLRTSILGNYDNGIKQLPLNPESSKVEILLDGVEFKSEKQKGSVILISVSQLYSLLLLLVIAGNLIVVNFLYLFVFIRKQL